MPEKWLLSRYEGFICPGLIVFVTGSVVASAFPSMLPWGTLALLVLAVVSVILNSKDRWVIKAGFWLGLFLVGFSFYNCFSFHPGPDDISQFAPQKQITVEGVVMEGSSPGRYVLEISAVENSAVSGNLAFRLSAGEPLLPLGATVRLAGNLALPGEAAFPGAFDEKAYLKPERIAALLKKPVVMEIIDEQPAHWRGALFRTLAAVRERIMSVFEKVLSPTDAQVLGGVVLGSHAVAVDKDLKQQFAATGMIHLLAASGMNVGIIAGVLLWLGSLFISSYRIRLIVAMTGVLCYMGLAGLSPSILRAGVMLELALALKLWDRDLSPQYLLSIAVFALVLFNPDVVGNLGFRLSVLSTLGLITMVPPLQEALGKYVTQWLAGLILVPVIAQLWVLPLSVYHFNQMPLHSVPLNMLAAILVVPLTGIGFLAGLLSLFSQTVGGWITWIAVPFLKLFMALVSWGNGMDWAMWSLPSPEPGWVVLAYLLLFAMVLIQEARFLGFKHRALALSLACFVGAACLALPRIQALQQTRIEHLPLSWQTQAWVLTPAGSQQKLVLIQGAPSYYAGKTLADYLKRRAVTNISALVFASPPDKLSEEQFMAPIEGRTQVSHVLFASPITLGDLQVATATDRLYVQNRQGNCLLALGETDAMPGCKTSFSEEKQFYAMALQPDARLAITRPR